MREGDANRCDVRSRSVAGQLERDRQSKLCPCRVQRRGGGVVDQEQEAFSLAVCARRHTIAQQTPITRQTFEPFLERGAGSQCVLDEVERASGQRLGDMDAESVVACEGRGQAPRRVGHRFGDACIRILEPCPAEEPPNGSGVDVAAFNPSHEVRQYPTLYGGRDHRVAVSHTRQTVLLPPDAPRIEEPASTTPCRTTAAKERKDTS